MDVNRDCCLCPDHGLITKWILEELNPGQANRKKLRMLQHRMQLVSILKHASLKMLSNRNYKALVPQFETNYSLRLTNNCLAKKYAVAVNEIL